MQPRDGGAIHDTAQLQTTELSPFSSMVTRPEEEEEAGEEEEVHSAKATDTDEQIAYSFRVFGKAFQEKLKLKVCLSCTHTFHSLMALRSQSTADLGWKAHSLTRRRRTLCDAGRRRQERRDSLVKQTERRYIWCRHASRAFLCRYSL